MENSILGRTVRTLLCFLLVALLLASCGYNRTEKPSAHLDLSPLMLMDTAQMRPSLLRTLWQLMGHFPTRKAFILNCTYLYKYEGMMSNGVNIHNDIFLFQPAYQYAFDGGEWSMGECYPSCYFVLDDKVVFVPSRNDGFLRQTALKQVYDSIVREDANFSYSNLRYLLVVHGRDSVRVLPDLEDDDIEPIVRRVRKVKFVPPAL